MNERQRHRLRHRQTDNNNNNNNNNNRIQRCYSRFFTISSQRREPSPTRTLKWPGRNRVQITCNTQTQKEKETEPEKRDGEGRLLLDCFKVVGGVVPFFLSFFFFFLFFFLSFFLSVPIVSNTFRASNSDPHQNTCRCTCGDILDQRGNEYLPNGQ